MDNTPNAKIGQLAKVIVVCRYCQQKIRLPKSRRRLHVTCPSCRHEFRYRYYALGLSSLHIKLISLCLLAGFAVFILLDLLFITQSSSVWQHILLAIICLLLGLCTGMAFVYSSQINAARLRSLKSRLEGILYLIAVIGLFPLVFSCTVGFIYHHGGGRVYNATSSDPAAQKIVEELNIKWICQNVAGIWGMDITKSGCQYGIVFDKLGDSKTFLPVDASTIRQYQLQPDYTWWQQYGWWTFVAMSLIGGSALLLIFLLRGDPSNQQYRRY